jgi:hypothetical protein
MRNRILHRASYPLILPKEKNGTTIQRRDMRWWAEDGGTVASRFGRIGDIQPPGRPRRGASSAVYKIAGGIAVLLFSFWGTLFLLGPDGERADPDACPPGERIALAGPYSRLGGYAYRVALPSLASLGDTDANLTFSPTLLCEDNLVLGPPHTVHTEIARGWGRFSHYGDSVIFSSSDNSDPNSNGRQYTIVVPSKRR